MFVVVEILDWGLDYDGARDDSNDDANDDEFGEGIVLSIIEHVLSSCGDDSATCKKISEALQCFVCRSLRDSISRQ